MKKQNWKKVISLVAGSLVIALVVSILPGGFLVNAAEISRTEAKKIALEKLELDRDDVKEFIVERYTPADDVPYYLVTVKTETKDYEVEVLAQTQEVESINEAINLALAKIDEDLEEDDENVVVSVNDDHADDARKPYYTITVKIEEDDELDEEYEVRVYINSGEVVIVKEVEDEEASRPKQDKIPVGFDNIDEDKKFEEFEEYVKDYDVKDNDYADYSKPTEQAELNMFLRDAKKYAMSEFDKDEFKVAKDVLKDVKSGLINDNPKKDEEETNKVNEKLVNKVKLTKEQALLKILRKIGLDVKSVDLPKLEKELSEEYGIDVKIEEDDSIYTITFEYKNNEYVIKISSSTGEFLEYEKESIKIKDAKSSEIEDEDDDDDNDDNDEDEDEYNEDNDEKGNDKVKNKGKNNK